MHLAVIMTVQIIVGSVELTVYLVKQLLEFVKFALKVDFNLKMVRRNVFIVLTQSVRLANTLRSVLHRNSVKGESFQNSAQLKIKSTGVNGILSMRSKTSKLVVVALAFQQLQLQKRPTQLKRAIYISYQSSIY